MTSIDSKKSKVSKMRKFASNDLMRIFPSVILITPVRYALSSEHIRIIQVASIHELMEKYKNSGKQQRDTKPIKSASSGGIKINLT